MQCFKRPFLILFYYILLVFIFRDFVYNIFKIILSVIDFMDYHKKLIVLMRSEIKMFKLLSYLLDLWGRNKFVKVLIVSRTNNKQIHRRENIWA